SSSDSRNTITEVDNAMFFALRATISASPRVVRMNPAPISGRNVTSDSSGQWLMVLGLLPRDQVPGDQRDDADQHGKGVMVNIAGLQPACAKRRVARPGGDAVDDTVDNRSVTGLPQPVAEAKGAAHEQPVVKLVEVPFVQQEQVQRAE